MITSQLEIKKRYSVWNIIAEILGMLSVLKFGAKIAERWAERSPHLGVSGHYQEFSTRTKLASWSHHCWQERFSCRTGNHAPEKSVKVSGVIEALESKAVKVMWTMFFNVKSTDDSEFLLQSQKINQQVKEILWRTLYSVREERWEFWQEKQRLLHYDNAPAQNALWIR